ncbi:DUF4190 domain-containing protein [Konateibacter massiliensis]|uniref:DUF4190 domain-containing protein n=1 Tax=Konateibacter massiliensis TaxID=2002841 RepID=UPI000C14D24D|nr:DUF4190 domain-containing protein [Konateibacter massiliensis]
MDYNNNEPASENTPVPTSNYYDKNEPNGMATATLVLGILAIVSICCVYGSYIFGGIAIALGLLSRGKGTKLSTNALIGVILSIVGMAVSTFVLIFMVITMIASYGSMGNFLQDYNAYYKEIYGEDLPFDTDLYDNEEYDYNDYYNDDIFDYFYDYDYDYDYSAPPTPSDL